MNWRMMKRATALAVATMLLAPVAQAAETNEIWTYWGAGSEQAAIDALIAESNKEFPNSPITHKIVTGNNAEMRQALQLAFLGGNPPVAYQSGMGLDLKSFVDGGRLASIEDVWADVKGDDVFPPGLQRALKFEGKPYGIPVNMAVISNVFYNKKMFAELNITPPTTWEEFDAAAAKIKAAGYQALGDAGGPFWSLYNFYAPLVSTIGVDGYFKLGSGEMAFNSPEIRKAFELYTKSFVKNYMADWTGYKWTETADQFAQGKVGMYMNGDWTSAYLKEKGMKPGEDYDFFPAPGTGGAAIIQVDVVALTAGASPPATAAGKDFLRAAAGPAGQAAFNEHKGSVAANLTTPDSVYDYIGKKTAAELKAAGEKNLILPNLYFLLPSDLALEFGTQIEGYAQNPTPAALDAMLTSIEALRKQAKDEGKFVAW
jgi:glucose/mannose transport system substrate-binding protein